MILLQQMAWQLSILFISIIVIVFVFILFRTSRRQEYAPIQKKGYRIRNIYFVVLLLTLVIFTGLSISKLPYDKPTNASGPPIVIEADGFQFGWTLSSNEAQVGQTIEFHVTSSDVNHGLGIYDENMQLVAQTQAMPEYTNVLYHTFTEPGTYQFLCMEYCGVSHHYMISEFKVSSGNGG